MMTVWMHDRPGVVGTKTAINIHKVGEISTAANGILIACRNPSSSFK